MLNPNSQFMEAPVPRSVAHLVALAVSPRLPPVMGNQAVRGASRPSEPDDFAGFRGRRNGLKNQIFANS